MTSNRSPDGPDALSTDGAPWADIRGREITPHYLAKLLRPFGISSERRREAGAPNPTHHYARAGFEDAWTRYLAPASDTTSTTDAETPAEHDAVGRRVPDVPDVPLAGPDVDGEAAAFAAAWRIFGDDVEWVEGLA